MTTLFATQEDLEYVIECQDNLDFMANLPDGSFKLIVTSPPYNIGKPYEHKALLEDYLASQGKVVAECVRLLDERGSICWQVGNYVSKSEIVPLDALFHPIFASHGLKMRNRIIWHFGHGLHCTKRLSGRYETINWWTKGDDYIWNLDPIRVPAKYPDKRHFRGPKAGRLSCNPKGKNPSDVWEFPNVKSNHPEKTIHPCQYPVELVERLVLSMTDEGDAVLDPFIGVGSTAIAALKHNRVAYGCDIEAEYVKVARERIGKLMGGELKTRPMGKPIYEPKSRNQEIVMLVKKRRYHPADFGHMQSNRPSSLKGHHGVIAGVDAKSCKTKDSCVKNKLGQMPLSPWALKKALRREFGSDGWVEHRVSFM